MRGNSTMNASQRSFAKGALYAYLNPRLATDIAFDRIPIWPADRMQIAVRKAVRGRLANDADIEDLPDFIASLQQMLEEMDNGNGEEDPNSSGNDNDQELPSMSPDDLAATIKANMSAYNAD